MRACQQRVAVASIGVKQPSVPGPTPPAPEGVGRGNGRWFRRRGLLSLGAAASLIAAALGAPAPAAAATAAVGMPIVVAQGTCSIGFFGFNKRGDRLAVTAGHCADPRNGDVRAEGSGTIIGRIVRYQLDTEDSHGHATGSRGYALIELNRRSSLDPFFTALGTVTVGDSVTKYGERSGKTTGKITAVHENSERPDLSVVEADVVQLHGDSGSPWYTGPRTLVAMSSSGNQDTVGGQRGRSQAQPIADVLKLIRADTSGWGEGFNVWLQK